MIFFKLLVEISCIYRAGLERGYVNFSKKLPLMAVLAIRKFPKMAFSQNLTYWPVV